MTRPPAAGSRWLVRRVRRPDAPIDLYCFPHAGGSAGEYVRWSDDLAEAQVWGVQLPGRASRMSEPSITRMDELVERVVDGIDFGERFALFGHSLGSLVAFEVARALQRDGKPLPQRLFVSSGPPPPVPRGTERIHDLPDDAFLTRVEQLWGALPEPIKSNADLLKIALGQFRADLAVFETYEHQPGPPLDSPITAFAGAQEALAADLDGWKAHTAADFESHVLPGHHFYLREQKAELLRHIAGALRHTA
ncbi:thioesterase II family protein [Saccharopolyspora taberi]|uniref:Alpha/beta fold hydrolase n=1 Tax=Saccharopolyspora taberi TaxID=60895 RepID=A0ABN3V3P5_9PSEU